MTYFKQCAVLNAVLFGLLTSIAV